MTEVADVNPGPIPDELKERDQWLLWDASSDSPRRPHWRGDFGVSWSDPDDWHTFDEAVDAASERDSWGIGYVMASANPDHPRGLYACLDLDGCLETRDSPKEWLPSLQAFIRDGAYIEYSPSGDGLHIPLVGQDAPDWWRDSHFGPEEHEGVEFLAHKFVTFTGDEFDLGAHSSDGVTDVNPVGFLRDAYEEINGEAPTLAEGAGDGATDDYDGDEWLGRDDVEEALDQLDPDVPYPEWRNIGFAVHDYDPTAEGKRLFRDWSADGTKYDEHAEALIDSLWDGATQGSGVTTGTLVHKARTAGWEPPARPQSTADGGATIQTNTEQDPPNDVEFSPDGFARVNSLGMDTEIADLNDRQKAAGVWDMVKLGSDYHVRVRRDTDTIWAYDGGTWSPNGERTLRHAAREALGAMNYGQNVLQELKSQAKADPTVEVAADEFGVSAGTIAVENGLVYLDAAADGAGRDAIRPLRPDDYALVQLPVEYDPAATSDEWNDYVEEWAEDGRADALQEYVGYCLHIGEIPIHRALLLVGSGANGKGTFLSVVRDLLGPDNTSSTELQTLANEPDAVAEFYGSLANIDDDLSARKLGSGLGMFKKLVAGDRVRARRLYEDGFEFDATGKHLYAANEVPQVDVPDDDEAFWRRWLLVEFPNHYPPSERDPGLADRFTQPERLSGVLNWAIEGWARLLEQGHFTGEEQYAHEKRERWQAWGESVDKFISECVERDEDAPRISTQDAHRRYAAWCRENDHDPIGQRKLTGKLKNEDLDYGRHRIDGSTTRGFKALGFADDVPELDETPDRDGRQGSLT